MKVKQLIAELKKMPQHLDVYTADHDHGEFEVSSGISAVNLVDQKDASEYQKQDPCFTDQPERYVVIHA